MIREAWSVKQRAESEGRRAESGRGEGAKGRKGEEAKGRKGEEAESMGLGAWSRDGKVVVGA